MRVLHVTATYAIGGVPLYIDQLARDQQQRGWKVLVACPKGGHLSRILTDATPQVRWPLSSRPDHLARSALMLQRIVADFDPEVIHLHASVAGAVGRMVIRGTTATIFQPHAWSFYAVPPRLEQPTQRYERLLARWADAIVCGSPGEADDGAQLGLGPLVTIDNAIDTDRFRPASEARRAELRAEFGVGDGPVVVSVGRLAEQKNPQLLIEAWKRVDRPDATLLLVGDGKLRNELAADLPSNVRLLGTLADPLPAHQVADLSVLASRYETRSLAILEAMACGSPVVSTDVSGVADVIHRGNGSIVPQNDVGTLARSIAQWLDRPDELNAARTAARDAIHPTFALERWADQMADVYRSVIVERA